MSKKGKTTQYHFLIHVCTFNLLKPMEGQE